MPMPLINQLETADIIKKLNYKKKQIEQFRMGLKKIERRINELLEKL